MRYSLIVIISVLFLFNGCNKDEPSTPTDPICNLAPPLAPEAGESFFFSAELLQSGGNFSMTITDGCNPRFFSEGYTFPNDTSGYYSFGMNEVNTSGLVVRRLEIGRVVDNVTDHQSIYEAFSPGKKDVANRPGTLGVFLLYNLGEEIRLTSTEDDQNPGFFRINERFPLQESDGLAWFDIQGDFEMAVRLETTGVTDRFRGSFSLRIFLP